MAFTLSTAQPKCGQNDSQNDVIDKADREEFLNEGQSLFG